MDTINTMEAIETVKNGEPVKLLDLKSFQEKDGSYDWSRLIKNIRAKVCRNSLKMMATIKNKQISEDEFAVHLDCCLSLFIDCLPREIGERIINNTIERMQARKPLFDSSKQGDICSRMKQTFMNL